MQPIYGMVAQKVGFNLEAFYNLFMRWFGQ